MRLVLGAPEMGDAISGALEPASHVLEDVNRSTRMELQYGRSFSGAADVRITCACV